MAFGKQISVQYIELADRSIVDSNICKSNSVAFTAFEILTSCSSWYNKHGFRNKYTDNEIIK